MLADANSITKGPFDSSGQCLIFFVEGLTLVIYQLCYQVGDRLSSFCYVKCSLLKHVYWISRHAKLNPAWSASTHDTSFMPSDARLEVLLMEHMCTMEWLLSSWKAAEGAFHDMCDKDEYSCEKHTLTIVAFH
jgi:hypothetical protein